MKNTVDYGPFTTMETIEAVADGLRKLTLTQKVEAIKAACPDEDVLGELGYHLTLTSVNMAEGGGEEEVESPVDAAKEDMLDFLAFCRKATDDQLQNIYAKEMHHNREPYAAMALMAANERGMVIDKRVKWTGEERPV